MKVATLLSSAAILAVATIANAAPSLSVTSLGTPGTAANPLTGYTAYKVTATPDAGDRIGTIDASSAAFGVTGTVFQRWTDPEAGGDYAPNPTGAVQSLNTAAGTDSRFLTSGFTGTVSITSTQQTSENNSGTGAPAAFPNSGSNFYGLGTSIKATVGYAGTTNGQALDFLYVVVPNSSTAVVAASVFTQNFGGGVPLTITVGAVPEPTSAALAGLAILGLAKRRRA